jgi:hypothetical protein
MRWFCTLRAGLRARVQAAGQVPSSSEQPLAATAPIAVVHPNSKSVGESSARVICVVTTVLNGEKFLEATLASVLSQSGDFFIDYFIKDAGSTDGTASILQGLLQEARLWKAVRFALPGNHEFASSLMPDRGLYDALHYSFKQDFWRNDPS